MCGHVDIHDVAWKMMGEERSLYVKVCISVALSEEQ